jgi:DeoR/GlpR family transcriptional regulator of sugar metabolism
MALNKNKTELRHEKIIQMLADDGTITIAAFCKEFGCSESTMRNDLSALEKEGKLRRVFGGAIRMEQISQGHLLSERAKAYLAEKETIAHYVVVNFLTPDMIIILDASTTNQIIAKKIAETGVSLTVLTNYLPIANIFADLSQVSLYLFGGNFNRGSRYFYDSRFSDTISSLRADILFVGVNGIHTDGFTVAGRDESFIKAELMKIAKKTIVVADHSKFNQSSMYLIDDFAYAKTLVTDAGTNESSVKKLREAGVDVRIAEI